MKRYKNPGLPNWPALFWDERRRKAIIRDKVGSWKSHARADAAWGIAFFAIVPLTGMIAFQSADRSIAGERLTAILGTWAVLLIVAAVATRYFVLPIFNLYGFKSQQVIVFTPDRIRVSGRNHPRQHNGSPLSITCMIGSDAKVQKKLQLRHYGPKWTHRYQIARCINLVVRVAGGDAIFGGSQAVGPGRTIEMAKVLGDEKAEQFSAVCQAALELTAPAGEQRTSAIGVDLDALL